MKKGVRVMIIRDKDETEMFRRSDNDEFFGIGRSVVIKTESLMLACIMKVT